MERTGVAGCVKTSHALKLLCATLHSSYAKSWAVTALGTKARTGGKSNGSYRLCIQIAIMAKRENAVGLE